MYIYQATVEKVVDGDTIDVSIDLGFKIFVKHRVRLCGINCAEMHGIDKELAIKAKLRVEQLLPKGTKVELTTYKIEVEKYGRYLADVSIPDKVISISQLLLQEKLAKPYLKDFKNVTDKSGAKISKIKELVEKLANLDRQLHFSFNQM